MRHVAKATVVVGLTALLLAFLACAAGAQTQPPSDPRAAPESPIQVAAALPTDWIAQYLGAIPDAIEPAPGVQVARLTSSSSGSLSPRATIELAYEYAWNEDADNERACLTTAAGMSDSIEAARATVLLAEATLFTGDKANAQSLLERARTQSQDPEILAFADLVQGFVALAPAGSSHGRRFYSDPAVMQTLCADAAATWKGTFLGGWAAIRLAAVLRLKLSRFEDAAAVLKQVAQDYAGTPYREYALEDLAATFAFSLGDFVEGRRMYEQLLAITTSDFIRQRATLHLGEVLMDRERYYRAYDLYNAFVTQWPNHADSVGAYMLRGYVASKFNLWRVAVADANRYLTVTETKLPDYTGKAHLVLGRAAFGRGQLEEAETEFLMVDHKFLIPEARASVGHCRAIRGDLQGALSAFTEAAQLANADNAPGYLYQAGLLAQQLGDDKVLSQILSEMMSRFPNNYLTSRLAGHEVTFAGDI